ncbi:MAG: hypothetical protein K0R54_100 [Clostridiaceae bacterium]|jgi:hypothetical protein|nr:hypothetical protein [Clostridiaceae bacterium]
MEKKKYYRFENESEDSNNFILKEKLLYGANRNCFISKEEAKTHFEDANKIALEKYKNIMNGINKLKESLGDFSYDYFMCGDTYGIESDGMYIHFEVNGYDFQFPQ